MAVQKATGHEAAPLTALGARKAQQSKGFTQEHSPPTIDEQRKEKVIQLLEWEHLPAWKQRGCEHLRTGYRPVRASLWSCLHSWSYLHNETINIFTHVVGAVIFLALPLYVFRTEIPPRYKVATMGDIIVCSIYFLGVGVCFTLSTMFHTFMCHSEAAYSLGVKLDYQGIILLIWGANIALIYYSMPCDLSARIAYWTFNSILAGLCSYATFHPSIGGAHTGHARAILFATFGFCAVVAPNLIGLLKHGFEEQNRRVGLNWIAATTLFNSTGVVVYASKFPEKWYPRVFDIFGASHQIMHIMAVSAALAFAKAMLQAFDLHHQNPQICVRDESDLHFE
ncbi:hemolysin-III channel protein-like protein Izh2 [Daldinia bambusicola]|nr:hemolysin-III channel protein-like protein Izh2 [Daldinia bambusicola]